MWQMSQDIANAAIWFRLVMVGVILINIAYLIFVFVFLGLLNRKKLFLLVNILFCSFFMYLNFTPKFYGQLVPKYDSGYWPVANVYTSSYILFWHFQVVYGVYCLIKGHKMADDSKKQQIKYFAIAMVIGYLGGASNWPMWYGKTPILPYSNILITVGVGIIAYTIIRYKLMEIEVIIKKTIVYSALITTITVLYFITMYTLERGFSTIIGYHSIPLAIATIAFFSIVFTPLKNRIQRSVDKYFFKGTIDQIEQEKKLLETELQRSERLKTVSTLAAGMAHEIKNPLTSIKTFVEYIDKKYHDPQFKTKFKNIVPKAIDKISSIINQLLDYSKADKVSMKSCDIHGILDYVLDLYNNEFLRKRIRVQKLYNAQIPIVICEENQLKQVFINIILNSIEAMSNGGSITIESRNKRSVLEISIKDTGEV